MKVETYIQVSEAGYAKCFAMLIGIHEGTIRSHSAEKNSLDKLVHIFIKYNLFLWQAGYTERVLTALRLKNSS